MLGRGSMLDYARKRTDLAVPPDRILATDFAIEGFSATHSTRIALKSYVPQEIAAKFCLDSANERPLF